MKRNVISLKVLCLLMMTVIFGGCDDDEPVDFSVDISVDWNGVTELSDGDELIVNSVSVNNLVVDGNPVQNPKIAKVQYFIGNRLVGESQDSPYSMSCELKDLLSGVHQFRVDVVFANVPEVGDFRCWSIMNLIIK